MLLRLFCLGCTVFSTLGFFSTSGATDGNPFQIAAANAQIRSSPNSTARNNCQPPQSNEYLILVLNNRADTQSLIQQEFAKVRDENGKPLAPVLTACTYLNDPVIRVHSFSSAETASEWAQYLTQQIGLQAFVTRPAQSGGTPRPPGTGVDTGSSPGRYEPRLLGQGYAVIVNYFDRPETATQVRQVTRRNVGLVAYNQSPFLLAIYTASADEASTVLRNLSDRGLVAGIVDSRGVVLLTPTVVETTTPTRSPVTPTTPNRPPDNTGGGRSG